MLECDMHYISPLCGKSDIITEIITIYFKKVNLIKTSNKYTFGGLDL